MVIHGDEIEIAPSFLIRDWNNLKKRLDSSGRWSEEWEELISKIERRLQTRFLHPAVEIKKLHYAGFALLALDCFFLESLQAFRSGQHGEDAAASRKAFKAFLRDTSPFDSYFPNEKAVDQFYSNVRIGLLHDGETRSGWVVKKNKKYKLIDRSQSPCNGPR